MVFIKTLAWCVIESDEEIVVGRTRGLRGVDVTAHPLKGLLSRPFCSVFSPRPSLLPSLPLLSAVRCSGSWHKLLAPGDYFSISPFLSSFFPPTEPSSKSLPSSLIPLFLLHRHNASSTQTNHRHRGDLSRRRSISDSPTIALTAMEKARCCLRIHHHPAVRADN